MKSPNDNTSAHTKLLREILLAIGSRPDCIVWEHKTGLFRLPVGEGRVFVGLPGSPDIVGFTSGGRFLGIEVKTGGGKLTPQQHAFSTAANRLGVVVCVARSVDEAVAYVNRFAARTCVDDLNLRGVA